MFRLLLHYHWREKLSNSSFDYSVTIYPTTYPLFTTDTISKYIICVSWEQFVIVFVALYWMGSDIMFAQMTTHTAIQFRVNARKALYFIFTWINDTAFCMRVIFIFDSSFENVSSWQVLRHDLKYITTNADSQDSRIEKVLIARLSRIARRHRDLYRWKQRPSPFLLTRHNNQIII